MATHSRVLAWRIPGMGEPGGLLSMGSHRVGHDWGDLAAAVCHCKKFDWKHHSAWRGVKEKELTIAVKCDNILGEVGLLSHVYHQDLISGWRDCVGQEGYFANAPGEQEFEEIWYLNLCLILVPTILHTRDILHPNSGQWNSPKNYSHY